MARHRFVIPQALQKNSNLGEYRAISTVPRAKRGGDTLDITPKF